MTEKCQLKVFISRFDFALETFFITKIKGITCKIQIFRLLQVIVQVDVLQKI